MLKVSPRLSPTITQIEKTDTGVKLYSARGVMELRVYADDIVRVMYITEGEPTADLPLYFCTKEMSAPFTVKEESEAIILFTAKLQILIDRSSSSLYYKDVDGNVLLSERATDSRTLERFVSTKMVVDENTKVKEVETADGIKRVVTEATTVDDRVLYKTRLHLNFADGEGLYGLGQHEEGSFNYRGTTQYIHQANMKIAIPLLLSTNGWGILLTGGSPAVFNDTAYGSYIYTEADAQMDYFFIGGDMKNVVGGYRRLTGKVALLPRWAFGYVQSQERYDTQQEILSVVSEYRKRGIGLDLIVLDWESWIPGLWGQKTFDAERFPNPTEMISRLKDENVHFMISIWPNMNEGGDNYKEFEKANLLLPASDIYDALNPEAREMYWRQAKDGLFVHGVDAWWCDSNEPVTPEWTHLEKPEPGEMYHEFYATASKHLPAEQCNAFGVYHSLTMYDGQRKTAPDKRVCVLTRNGYTGGQAYGTILWSGDISASWETLQNQIPAGLNMSLSGIPFWTLDSGAFFIKKGVKWFWNGEYDAGWDDLGYCELAVRWLQYATFLPIMRGHGTDIRREFYSSGDAGTPYYDAMVASNRLRYSLLPYIYSLAGNSALNDDIMMKPLVYSFPKDERVKNIGDEFMLGDEILVCPVTNPMYYGVGSTVLNNVPKNRSVYLPSGCDWYDFYSNERYTGGNTIVADAPLERIPVFIKAGSVIPLSGNKDAMTADEALASPLELRVYTGADCEYNYYEDAGDGYGYEKGEYRVTTFEYKQSNKEVKVKNIIGNSNFNELSYNINMI